MAYKYVILITYRISLCIENIYIFYIIDAATITLTIDSYKMGIFLILYIWKIIGIQ